MKFISWNVNGLRACVQKGFLDFFHTIDADFRNQSFRKGRLTWIYPDIINTGITQRKRATPVQPFLPNRNLLRSPTALVSLNMTEKDV